ncbi:MAG: OprD family outer membrane porin [Candidatus Eremiobacteraeota bacterium]|nr:OprD family outer membrane porin [Candidatus Eremiobacteraeota bacterium]
MTRSFMGVSFFMCCAWSIAAAQSTPAPAPTVKPAASTPSPYGFHYSGNARIYYFTRTNRVGVNASAFNTEAKLHGEYTFPGTPWTIGATYFGAEPFGANGQNPGFNKQVDNTLPGYALSLLGEYYLQYKTKYAFGITGREIINTPWANPSDSRLVPVIFQGTAVSFNLSPQTTLGAMYMARFRHRTSSAFESNTLLTSCDNTTSGVPGDPCNPQFTTKGFLLIYGTHKISPQWTLNTYNYQIYDIINLLHVDTKFNYAPKSPMNPYVALQYIAENNTGASDIGIVKNHTFGFQFGASPAKTIDLHLGFNESPTETFTVSKASLCGNGSGKFAPKFNGIFGGGVGGKVPGAPKGTVYCYAGGLASPYTDSYATDPLYTTTISQGLADTHKPGYAEKIDGVFQTPNHRFRLILAQGWYNYTLPSAATDRRREFNADLTYFFNPVDPNKPYHGLAIRHRYADRVQLTAPFDFKYNRTQLEYSF